MMASRGEIVEEPPPPVQVVEDELMYVAVCKELREGKPILSCALHNSGGRYEDVHEPAQRIPLSNS